MMSRVLTISPSGKDHSSNIFDRYDGFLLALLFLLAFVLRMVYLHQIRGNPFFIPFDEMLDPFIYDSWARRIAEGNWLGRGVFPATPLYPYLLGIIYFLFGRDILLVTSLQALLGSVTPLLIYAIARKLFNRKIATIAGLLTAGYGLFIFYVGILVGTTVTVFINCILLALLVNWGHSLNWIKGLAAGVLAALSLLSAGLIAPFIPGLIVWSFIISGRRKGFTFSIFLLIGLLLVVAPVTLRNARRGGDLVLIAAHGGINFYIGNNPEAGGSFSLPGYPYVGAKDIIERSRAIAERELGKKLKASEVTRYWLGRALDFIRSQPGNYAKLVFKKFRAYWSVSELSDIIDFEFFKRYSSLLAFPLPAFGIVAPLAIAGLVVGLSSWRKLLLIYIYTFSQMLSCLLFFVNSRYRLPVVPGLIIFASFGLYWATVRLLQRDRKGLLLFLVPLIAGIVITWSIRFPLDTAASHYDTGNAYRSRDMIEQALEEYRTALRLNPGLPGVRINIGMIHETRNQMDEAMEAYRGELEVNPYSWEAHNNLGNIYNRSHQLSKAEAHYRRAIDLAPPRAGVHINLGTIYAKQGQVDKAMEEWRRALEINPGCRSKVRDNIRALERMKSTGHYE